MRTTHTLLALGALAVLLAGCGQGVTPAYTGPTKAVTLRFPTVATDGMRPLGVPNTVNAANLTVTDTNTDTILKFNGSGNYDPAGSEVVPLTLTTGMVVTLHIPSTMVVDVRLYALTGTVIDGLGHYYGLAMSTFDTATPIILSAQAITAGATLLAPTSVTLGKRQAYKLQVTAPSGAPVPTTEYSIQTTCDPVTDVCDSGWYVGSAFGTPDAAFGDALGSIRGANVLAKQFGGVVYATVHGMDINELPVEIKVSATMPAPSGAAFNFGIDLTAPVITNATALTGTTSPYNLHLVATDASALTEMTVYLNDVQLIATVQFDTGSKTIDLSIPVAPQPGDTFDIYVTDEYLNVSQPWVRQF